MNHLYSHPGVDRIWFLRYPSIFLTYLIFYLLQDGHWSIYETRSIDMRGSDDLGPPYPPSMRAACFHVLTLLELCPKGAYLDLQRMTKQGAYTLCFKLTTIIWGTLEVQVGQGGV